MSNNPTPIPKSEMYASGEYLKKHPMWHSEDSQWKAKQILKMANNHNLKPQTICEVGCGAGEILSQLQANMAQNCMFIGYFLSTSSNISKTTWDSCEMSEQRADTRYSIYR